MIRFSREECRDMLELLGWDRDKYFTSRINNDLCFEIYYADSEGSSYLSINEYGIKLNEVINGKNHPRLVSYELSDYVRNLIAKYHQGEGI